MYVRFNHIHAKRRIRAQKNKKADPLVATDATFAQGWMVDGAEKDEEGSDVEPVTGLTWKLIAETCGAEEVTKLRRLKTHRCLKLKVKKKHHKRKMLTLSRIKMM